MSIKTRQDAVEAARSILELGYRYGFDNADEPTMARLLIDIAPLLPDAEKVSEDGHTTEET